MVVLTMSCVSILFSVYILSIHHQRGKPMRCPRVIKFIFFKIIAPALFLTLRSESRSKAENNRKKKMEMLSDYESELSESPRGGGDANGHLLKLQDINNVEFASDEMLNDIRITSETTLQDIDPVLKHYKEKEKSVCELISWLQTKQKSEGEEDQFFQEWRDVAYVLDRVLFVVFLLTTVISTAYILSKRPEQVLSGFTEIRID